MQAIHDAPSFGDLAVRDAVHRDDRIRHRFASGGNAVVVPSMCPSGGGREQPDMILVCGGCANIPGIAEVISSRVGIPTEVGDPLGQMKISSKAKSQGVHKDATALLTACGLALRSFD